MIFSIVIWYKFSEASAGELGNTRNIYRMVLVIVAALSAINLLMKHSKDVLRTINLPLALLLTYGFTAFLSSLLIPQNAFYTMWKSIEIVIDVLAILGIIAATKSVYGPITAYRWLMFYNMMMLGFILAGLMIFPSEALRPSRGVIPFFLQGHVPVLNPNTVGFISVQLVLHSMASLFRSTRAKQCIFYAILLLASLVALILAQSRTSMVGLVAGIGIYLILDNKKWVLLSAAVFTLVVTFFMSGTSLITEYLLRGQSEELVMTLSGRTHGWAAAWDLFSQSPLFGNGFAAAARVEILGSQNASTLHGALFDVIVGVGLAGLIPWLLAIVLMLSTMAKLTFTMKRWITTKYERSFHAEMVGITAVLIIRSVTSSGIAMHEHAFMLMLCIIGYSYMLKREIQYKRNNRPAFS